MPTESFRFIRKSDLLLPENFQYCENFYIKTGTKLPNLRRWTKGAILYRSGIKQKINYVLELHSSCKRSGWHSFIFDSQVLRLKLTDPGSLTTTGKEKSRFILEILDK